MRGKTYEDIAVGDTAAFSKTVTESDIHAFSAITADFNPIHVDEVYAKGMLSASLFSTLIGMYIPGKGALYVSQTCNFRLPVKLGDTIRAECVVVEKMEKFRVRLETRCVNQRGEVVIDGEAIAIAARKAEDVV